MRQIEDIEMDFLFLIYTYYYNPLLPYLCFFVSLLCKNNQFININISFHTHFLPFNIL